MFKSIEEHKKWMDNHLTYLSKQIRGRMYHESRFKEFYDRFTNKKYKFTYETMELFDKYKIVHCKVIAIYESIEFNLKMDLSRGKPSNNYEIYNEILVDEENFLEKSIYEFGKSCISCDAYKSDFEEMVNFTNG